MSMHEMFDLEKHPQKKQKKSNKNKIASKLIDSLYQINKEKSLLKRGEQFKDIHYGNERDRLTEAFRNSGVFHFSQDYISFENDT